MKTLKELIETAPKFIQNAVKSQHARGVRIYAEKNIRTGNSVLMSEQHGPLFGDEDGKFGDNYTFIDELK